MLWVTVSIDGNVAGYVAVNDIWMMAQGGGGGASGVCSFPLSRCPSAPRPFLARQIFLGETLLAGLCFPIVVSYSTPVGDDSTTKLTEHGFRRHDRNLSRPIGIRQDLLVN